MTDWLPLAPTHLKRAYEGWCWTLAWSHAMGAVFRLEAPVGEARFLKITSARNAIRLHAEAERLRWARAYLPVPEVLDSGSADGIDWLITRGMPGRDGTHPDLLADPARLVATLGRGLRSFHEAAPVQACPFDFRLDVALDQVQRRAAEGPDVGIRQPAQRADP